MAFSIDQITKKQWAWAFGALVLVVLGYIAFNELQKADWKKKLEAELTSIDLRINSGRLSAGDLVDLKQKRNAIVQQYLKTL